MAKIVIECADHLVKTFCGWFSNQGEQDLFEAHSNGKWNEETGKSVSTMKKGDSGSLVRLLQEILVKKIKRELTISGSYDAKTEKAIKFVQEYYGLEENGTVTRPVWNVLLCCDYPVKA